MASRKVSTSAMRSELYHTRRHPETCGGSREPENGTSWGKKEVVLSRVRWGRHIYQQGYAKGWDWTTIVVTLHALVRQPTCQYRRCSVRVPPQATKSHNRKRTILQLTQNRHYDILCGPSDHVLSVVTRMCQHKRRRL